MKVCFLCGGTTKLIDFNDYTYGKCLRMSLFRKRRSFKYGDVQFPPSKSDGAYHSHCYKIFSVLKKKYKQEFEACMYENFHSKPEVRPEDQALENEEINIDYECPYIKTEVDEENYTYMSISEEENTVPRYEAVRPTVLRHRKFLHQPPTNQILDRTDTSSCSSDDESEKETEMKSSVQFSPNKHLENISKMFKKLYNDEQLADVTLCCKDGTIKAHKLILAASSPYFHKIFTENNREHPILIMHGISYQHLHNLIELIYKGNVDVLPESLNQLYELASEFQLSGISGVLREENDKTVDMNSRSETGIHNRDTRYRGLKRVAVDYPETKVENPVNQLKRVERDSTDSSKKDIVNSPDDTLLLCTNGSSPDEMTTDGEETPAPKLGTEEPPKLSAWAKKQRKFKCDLCPSSFKRSSHLTRHQLVHTGERPFACDQCDKAFSRHDKLKHHVRKTHEQDYETDYNMEMSLTISSSPPTPPMLPFVISHVRSEAFDEGSPNSPPKRPRGRPRKYPAVEKPLIKRGRGRPRLNPVQPEGNGENYDITNLPYGDLEYLTMPLQDSVMIEPYVEIKTEKEENTEEPEPEKITEEVNKEPEPEIATETKEMNVEEEQTNPTGLQALENRIAEIGECTISVANH